MPKCHKIVMNQTLPTDEAGYRVARTRLKMSLFIISNVSCGGIQLYSYQDLFFSDQAS